MPIIADTHVHIYPEYDVALLLECACRNLDQTARQNGLPSSGNMQRVLFLTESSGCDWFAAAGQGRLPTGWTAKAAPLPLCLTLGHERSGLVHCVPGRQMATKERLEILGLAMREVVPDGLSVHETLDKVQQAGGVPVLPWALGKWLFSRSRIVRDLVLSSPPDRFLIGDSAMRPSFSPWPSLMRLARTRGFGLVPGSDPLPLPGEERRAGGYALFSTTAFDPERPGAFLRGVAQDASARILGPRLGLVSVLRKTLALRTDAKHRPFPSTPLNVKKNYDR
ncbi:MAG TPA: hypothetical protein ENN39_12645 [Desulfonatronum sp.]|nr:hypothetical protein [Desulfonatronum sp.]